MTITQLVERCRQVAVEGQEVLMYLDDVYALAGPPALRERIASKLAPFVSNGNAAATPTRTLGVTISGVAAAAPLEICDRVRTEGERIEIDASLYPTATSGFRLATDDGHLVLIEKTGSLCVLRPEERIAGIFNPSGENLEQDLMRLVKSLISLHCEAQGMAILHASGVVTNGGCVLFAGDSRNGKTTTLLESMAGFEVAMLSCDTTIVSAAGSALWARGWPSNFSVSIGTMLDFTDLHPHLEPQMRELGYVEAWGIHPKHVLDTHAVSAAASWELCPGAELQAIVALELSTEGKGVGISPLSGEELDEFLVGVTLGSSDPLYPDWHRFWEHTSGIRRQPVVDLGEWVRRGQLEAYSMRWAPSPQTLLRRIPVLDDVHRHSLRVCGVVS